MGKPDRKSFGLAAQLQSSRLAQEAEKRGKMHTPEHQEMRDKMTATRERNRLAKLARFPNAEPEQK